MGRKIGKSAIEVMREQFPREASEIETYADAFDVLSEKVKKAGIIVHVPFTVTSENDTMTVTTDVTFDEVKSAIMAGKTVVGVVSVNGITLFAPVTAANPGDNPTAIIFGTTMLGGEVDDKPTLYQIIYTADAASVTVTELT